MTGRLVEPRSARALADACLELARRRPWAASLAAAGRLTVQAHFSHERNGRALISLYRTWRAVPGEAARPA